MQLTLFVVVLLLGLPVVSPAKEYNPSDLYDVEYFKLENGFDVVLKKRTHVPNVAVRLVVDVGMRHFPCGKQETPHFLEHLLLLGTSIHSQAELQNLTENHGGHQNGYTSSTETGYKIDIYDQHLPLAIDMLYEIMTDAVITPQRIESVRAVIYRERKGEYPWLIRWLYESGLFKSAVTKARELLLSGMGGQCLGLTTPDGITEADVRDTYANYYVPANMTLVVVGNFDRVKLVSQIKSTFGKLPPKASNGSNLISSPHFSGKKEATGILSPLVGSDGVVAIGYRTAGRYSPDFYALSLLAKYFHRIVFERIRVKEAMSYTTIAGYLAEYDFGFFVAGADVSLGRYPRAYARGT